MLNQTKLSVYVGLLAALLGLNVVVWEKPPGAKLEVEVASATANTQAEVYFDTGQGFNATEYATVRVHEGPISRRLEFLLPTRFVRAVRYDPLTTAGSVDLCGVRILLDNGREIQRLPLSGVKALNEIEILSLSPEGKRLKVKTTINSNDSQLLLPLGLPFKAEYTFRDRWRRVGWTDAVLFGVSLLILVVFRSWVSVRTFGERVMQPLGWLAARWRHSEFIPLDRGAVGFYVACVIGFGVLAAAGLHGSSIGIYNQAFQSGDAPRDTELLGSPRRVRSDEWGFHTPVILNQLFRANPMAVKDTTVGPGPAALLANVPCRHLLELFRPYFWAFHLFSADVAFAAYWQMKGLLLLTGTFTLFLLLTRSTSAAAVGALWYGLSAYTQWAYSWPSLLPEMVGLCGWAVVLFCGLLTVQGGFATLVAAGAFVLTAMGFALCFYPPHQIPLALSGLGITIWYVWTHRVGILSREGRMRRLMALVAALLVIAATVGLFLVQARESLVAAAHTVYPGQRSVNGGSVSLAWLLSNFLDFWKSEDFCPPALPNICEASGFLWLAPAALVTGLGWRRRSVLTAQPALSAAPELCLWIIFAVLAAWMTLPLPASLGRWLLLNRVPGFRCFHALGLLNAALVSLLLARQQLYPVTSIHKTPDATAGLKGTGARLDRVFLKWLGYSASLGMALVWANIQFKHFFSSWMIFASAIYCGWLLTCLSERWQKIFAWTLLVPLAWTGLGINPLDRGLNAIRDTSLFQAVEHNPDLKIGKCLVFGPADGLAGPLRAAGMDVFNSLQIIPHVNQLTTFDPTGVFQNIINQSGYLLAETPSTSQQPGFENPVVGFQIWRVYPSDARLKNIGIRFVAFPTAPESMLVASLRPVLVSTPGLWLYELP